MELPRLNGSTDGICQEVTGPPPVITPRQEWLHFMLVVLLFVASGFSSLIYQVVWTRLLVLVFGSTTFATSTVLAVFMGGLGLGSFLAGRISDRIKRPFLWYGILEGVIGLWALFVPLLFDAAIPAYRLAWQHLHLSLLPFSFLRFLIATAILIVPTTCMGATLPLLARFVTSRLDYVGERVGTLYAANTMGAVGGATLAGFVLLPGIGLNATTGLAALVNFMLCGAVTLMAPSLERQRETISYAPSTVDSGPLKLSVQLAVAGFGISGAIAMMYEVGWTRTLLLVIGSSTYAFTVMLSTFLIGIFIGSFLCARIIDRAKEPVAWFAILQFLVCLFGAFSMSKFSFLPWWNLSINAFFPHDPMKALGIRFLFAAIMLLPLTLCLGAIFPVVVKVATRELEKVGKSVGTIYSVNTLGAIIGAFLAGFVLIPWLGVEKTLVFASVANLLLGAGLLLLVGSIRVPVKALCLLITAGITFWCLAKPELWDHVVLLSAQAERRQLIQLPLLFKSFHQWEQWLHEKADALFWEDGASSTVGILQYRGSHRRSLVTNGHIDASDGFDMQTQILLSAYPLLWKPDAKDIAVIGWGSGVSVGAATLFPVSSITAIELEPAVLRASRFFHHANHHPEDNKLVHLELNDGRNYLLATDKKFDIIVSEPSNPWQAGVCNLFTQEYFQICHNALQPGGIFSFWLQTVEIPTENLREILKSLNLVFPYNVALMTDTGNAVVLASDRPLTIDFKRLKWLMANSAVAGELARIDIHTPEAVLARILVAPDGMNMLVQNAQANVDDTNHLEYAVGKSYENKFYDQENKHLLEQYAGSPSKVMELGRLSNKEQAEILSSTGQEALLVGSHARALGWAKASLAVSKTPEALRIAGIACLEEGRRKEAESLWKEALELNPYHVETLQTRGMASLQAGQREAARADFRKVLDVEPDNQAALYHVAQTYPDMFALGQGTQLALIAQKDNEPATVLNLLAHLIGDKPFVRRHPDVLYMASVANYQLGHDRQAEELAREYLNLEPTSVAGSRLLGSILFRHGNKLEASALWFSSYVRSQAEAEKLYSQAKELSKAGQADAAVDLYARGMELWPGNDDAYKSLLSLSQHNKKAEQLARSMKLIGDLLSKCSADELR